MRHIRKAIISVAGVSLLVGCGGGAAGEDGALPEGTIQHLVPVAPGGGTDMTHRGLAEIVSNQTGREVIVNNVEGAGGTVGFTQASNNAPDGLHLNSYTSEIFTLPILQESVGFEPDDFVPLVLISEEPASLVVGANTPYETIDEFLEAAAEEPSSINVGNSGVGNIWHLSARALEEEAGVEFNHVSYNGAAETVQAALGGHIDAFVASVPEVASQVEAGELRVLGVMGEEPVEPLLDVPTFQEAGIDVLMGTWRGLGVPAGTDEGVIRELESIYSEAIQSDEFSEFMNDQQMNIRFMGHDEFAEFSTEERERFEELATAIAGG